jgi:hypothetical protein
VQTSENEVESRDLTPSLGLAAGALLAEGAVLVPLWRAMSAREFLEWYPRNAQLLLRFFGPLEVVPTVIVAVVMAGSNYSGDDGALLWTAAAGLAVAVLLSFPIYFKAANESFTSGSIAEDQVEDELRRWAAWHWGRTFLATLSFGAALAGLAA